MPEKIILARDAVYVSRAEPCMNYLNTGRIKVGFSESLPTQPAYQFENIGLLQFESFDLSDNCRILGAALHMFTYHTNHMTSCVQIYPNIEAFDANTVNWLTKPVTGPKPSSTLLVKREDQCGYVTRVFTDMRRESALLLFTATLIVNPDDIEEIRKVIADIKKDLGHPCELICGQILMILEGTGEDLLKGEKPQELLTVFSRLLSIILDAGEFDLFEKLLYVYNYIDSPRVLLSLAAIYLESGFSQLAASTVLRSITELDTIDANGACLLTDALFFENFIP
jgi:hypothetical protein